MGGEDIMAKVTEMEAITVSTTRDQSQHIAILSMRKVQNIMLKCKAEELFSMEAKLDNVHIFHRSEQNGINETNSDSTMHMKIKNIYKCERYHKGKQTRPTPHFSLATPHKNQ